jgi:hypothetical protein
MKTYFIVQYIHSTGIVIDIVDTNNPSEAYEMANAWDAYIHFGPYEESKVLERDKHSSIYIVDNDENDCWKECCEARCPSFGLFFTPQQP